MLPDTQWLPVDFPLALIIPRSVWIFFLLLLNGAEKFIDQEEYTYLQRADASQRFFFN